MTALAFFLAIFAAAGLIAAMAIKYQAKLDAFLQLRKAALDELSRCQRETMDEMEKLLAIWSSNDHKLVEAPCAMRRAKVAHKTT